jgi:hypothetical protein
MDQSKPRGAAAINDELEVGYNPSFERKWRLVEVISHIFMAVIALAALAGLLGRGPLSHRTYSTKDGRLAIDFEPVARYGTSTQVTLHLSASDQEDRPVRVFVSSALVEPLGLQGILPEPVSSEAVGGGIVYDFRIPPGQKEALARFVLKPSVVGPVEVDVRQNLEALSFTQWVLP